MRLGVNCKYNLDELKLDWSVSTVQYNYLVDIYIYNLLHREQLHVSALDNGYLRVVYETLSKQLYKTHIWATYMG